MSIRRYALYHVAAIALLFTGSVYANQLLYVALPEPCRLLDTRAGSGTGTPLTEAGSPYLLGTDNASIASAAQKGNSAGCGIPTGVDAVNVSMNMIDPTLAGNIATWNADSGTTAPNIGTGLYNPNVQYNTGYAAISVGLASGSKPGKFYLKVANGQIDMTINVVGYWRPVSSGETVNSSNYAVALGLNTQANGAESFAAGAGVVANGNFSTAMGTGSHANGPSAAAIGYQTIAAGNASMALGIDTYTGVSASAPTQPSIPSTIAGGDFSFAAGFGSQATGPLSTAMGVNTIASGKGSTALGWGATASDSYTLAMGAGATASSFSSIAIGWSTQAKNYYAAALGVTTTASGFGSTALGDTTYAGAPMNAPTPSTSANGSGGDDSTAMGVGTVSTGIASTAMGSTTYAGAPAYAPTSTASLPTGTTAGDFSTAMGFGTVSTGIASTALGNDTTASGNDSTAIGFSNVASGAFSTAMGAHATAADNYSFVWGGSGSTGVGSNGTSSFTVYAPGGIYLSGSASGLGCVLSNSNTWSCSSDRNVKTGIVPVDARAVLAKLVGMPVSTWAFKASPEYKHIGPMAQDFKATFGLGDADDKHISTTDAQGVALAAIQGLYAELEDRDSKIAALRDDNASLRTRVASLESIANDVAELKAQLAVLRQSSTAAPITVALQP